MSLKKERGFLVVVREKRKEEGEGSVYAGLSEDSGNLRIKRKFK